MYKIKILLLAIGIFSNLNFLFAQNQLSINDEEYFETNGLNVMVFSDNYAEGHQGGITIVQHESRVAANGDLRLEAAPGQWQPIPKLLDRKVNKKDNSITVSLCYPDSNMILRKFNPLIYPDLHFTYQIEVTAIENGVRVVVNLEKPLPKEWIGKVGFNLELFPGEMFDKSYMMDSDVGTFHRQLNGPMIEDPDGSYDVRPMAEGHHLTIAPETEMNRMQISSAKNMIQLIDGRSHHNNGWFIARSLVPDGATDHAIVWEIKPNIKKDWSYKPVVQVSQAGYYPEQTKTALIECAKEFNSTDKVILKKISENGEYSEVLNTAPVEWGKFQRYKYLKFDFSSVKEPGLYQIVYGNSQSNLFLIDEHLFQRNVWQPTLEYFLPVQMCHMRVNDRYRVWHDLCHMDDALMAPTDTVHIDGYLQGPSTLTDYQPYEQVPGLDVGGWHDAGDYDLRVESQAGTVRILSLIKENFHTTYDQTLINQQKHLVELHQPDGKDDILQQIEHGVLTILGGYKNLGRLYRGIIAPTTRQYVLLGDASSMTDNVKYEIGSESPVKMDDRWVFTEENPYRELYVSECLAVAYRALKNYNNELATECLELSELLWEQNKDKENLASPQIKTLVELILSTNTREYKDDLVTRLPAIINDFNSLAWTIVRVSEKIDDREFHNQINARKKEFYASLEETMGSNPYDLPYRPQIWGAGWYIQDFGVKQYFLYKYWKEDASKEYMLSALNFVLGRHPSSNNISYVSGVGTKSTIVAYGVNRADWSYIPGGVVSGTSYIQPDLPEFKVWPFFWQQGEYVLGGGATNFMFLVLASQSLYDE